MKRKNITRNALFTSIISLLLCVSMLVGTTFAWFTDSATSGNNKIVAGNLDVELYHADKAQPTDELVGSTTKLFDDVTLWEPGAMVWEKLTVKNAGSLALKYNLSVNVNDISEVDGKSLADVLKVAVLTEQPTRENVASAAVQSLATFNLKSDKALTAGSSDVVYVAIYWAPSANDNDYNVANEALYADLGVTLLATQYTAESDSFNNQYDKDATYEGSVNLGGSSAEVSNLTETVWQVTDIPSREAFNVQLKKIKAESSLKVEVYHDDTLLTTSTLADSYFPITEQSFATKEGFNRLTANIVLSGYTSDSWNTVVEYSNLTEDNIPNHIKVYCDGALVANEYRIFDDEWVAAYKDLDITKKSVSAEIEHLNTWTVTDTVTQEAFNVQLKSLYVEDSLKVEVYHGNTLLTTTTANDIVWDLFENGYAERLTTLVVLSGYADEYWNTVVEYSNLTEDNIPNHIKVYCDGVLVADEDHTFDDAWIAAYKDLEITKKSVSAEIEHLNTWTVTDTATQEAFNVQLKSLYVKDSLKVEVYHGNTLLTTTTANDIVWDLFENGYRERLTTFVVLSGSADEYWTTVVETANLTEDNVPNHIKVYCDGVLVADEDHTFDDAWIAAYRGLDIVQ